MSGARFRDVVRSACAYIGGDIRGLKVNHVEVAPLVEAKLDRRHPERIKLHPTTPDGIREAFHRRSIRRRGAR